MMKRIWNRIGLALLATALACGGANAQTTQLRSSNVLFTGGSINGIVIGDDAAAAGSFTTLSATGAVTMLSGGNSGGFGGGEWTRSIGWGTYYKAPATGSNADIGFYDASGAGGRLWIMAANVKLGVGATTVIDVTATGSALTGTLSVTGATNLDAGTVSAPGLYLEGETGTGLYRIGANNHGYAVSGAKVLNIASTGLAVTGTLTSTSHLAIASGAKFYPDGVAANGDTYITQSSDNVLDFYAGGTNTLRLTSSSATVTGAASATGAVTALSGTAIPAGGTAGSGYKFSSTSNFGVFFGSGAPSLSAAKGSLYLRSDGSGTTDRAYINTDGGTTWTALTTGA